VDDVADDDEDAAEEEEDDDVDPHAVRQLDSVRAPERAASMVVVLIMAPSPPGPCRLSALVMNPLALGGTGNCSATTSRRCSSKVQQPQCTATILC